MTWVLRLLGGSSDQDRVDLTSVTLKPKTKVVCDVVSLFIKGSKITKRKSSTYEYLNDCDLAEISPFFGFSCDYPESSKRFLSKDTLMSNQQRWFKATGTGVRTLLKGSKTWPTKFDRCALACSHCVATCKKCNSAPVTFPSSALIALASKQCLTGRCLQVLCFYITFS